MAQGLRIVIVTDVARVQSLAQGLPHGMGATKKKERQKKKMKIESMISAKMKVKIQRYTIGWCFPGLAWNNTWDLVADEQKSLWACDL